MRKIGEVLRLKAAGLNIRDIAVSTGVGKTTVYEYVARAEAAGLQWPLLAELDEAAVEAKLFPPPTVALLASRPVPDWREVHREVKRGRHVSLRLLWLEWRAGHDDGWGYSQFCLRYHDWLGQQDVVMRLEYAAGDRCFVDFAGDRMPVGDGDDRVDAEIFVAVLGCSGMLYVEATRGQDLSSWLLAHVHAYEAWGGVPRVTILDYVARYIIRADLVRDGAKIVEGATVALHPRLLVALHHRPHEDAPAAERERHDEGLDHVTTPADWIRPRAHPAEVHPRNLPRRRRGLTHPHVLRTHGADAFAHVLPKRCQPHVEPALIAHPLPHRGHDAVLDLPDDLVMELRDPLLLLADPAADPTAEQQPNAGRPFGSRHQLSAASERRRCLLGDRRHSVASHAGAPSNLAIALPSIPEPEDFHQVCHIEPPASHFAPPFSSSWPASSAPWRRDHLHLSGFHLVVARWLH